MTGWEGYNQGVYVKDVVTTVDIITDTVRRVLLPPEGLELMPPYGAASLSGFILLGYPSVPKLVLYPPGEIYGSLIHAEGLESSWSIAVDPAGSFLVTEPHRSAVWVLSVSGKVLARAECQDEPYDITLSSDNSRLCIGNNMTGEISVLQSIQ